MNSSAVVLIGSEQTHGGHGESAAWRTLEGAGRARRMPEDASECALRSAIAARFPRHRELCRGLAGTHGLHHRADVDASSATASAVSKPQASGRAAVRVRRSRP
jgi:hypothetical protein